MYLPLNPNKIEGLWDKFLQSISDCSFEYVVSNGEQNSSSRSIEEPGLVTRRFKECEFSRIGTAKSVPIPAHYGVRIESETGYLQEYIARDASEDQIASDLRKLSQLIFYEVPTLRKLVIPFEVKNMSDQGVTVKISNGLTEITPS